MSRESVVLLCKCLPKSLTKLNISGCKTTLFDRGIFLKIFCFNSLKVLINLKFKDIENLVKTCPNLIELDLSDLQSLTSVSVENIALNLNQLEEVSFSRCYSIVPSSYL